MSNVKDFLKRKDIVITPQHYLIEALGAMVVTEKEVAEVEFNLCTAAAKLAMEIGDQSTLKAWQE